MQVAKIIPIKLIRKVIEGKLHGETSSRNFMIDCISKTVKIFADPVRKKIFLECLDSPKEFNRSPRILYHLRILEDYGITKYTSKGYAVTKFGRDLWESIREFEIIPNSYLPIKILLLLSKPKKFIELKKELKVNEGSLFRALKFLAENRLIVKKNENYNLSPTVDTSKLNLLISKYIDLIKDASYDRNLESLTFPKEKETKILDLFETKERKRIKEKLWREEDVIKDHVIISCSYTSNLEMDRIIEYILEEFGGSAKLDRVKLLQSYERNTIKLAYGIKYLSSLQKLLNLLHIHGWRAFDSVLIEDISFPKKFIKNFEGPKFGRKGIRKLLDLKDTPVLQAGLLPDESFGVQFIRDSVKKLFLAGVNEISESFAVLDDLESFKNRVELIAQLMDEIKDYGQKIYYFYIYGDEYEERLDILKEARSKNFGIMVSPITIGFPLASRIIKKSKHPVQIHLTLVAPFIKYAKRRITKEGEVLPGYGANVNVLLKLFILLGADEIPIESPFAGHYEWWETKTQYNILDNYFKELNAPLPVLFGNITPANTLTLVKNLGNDIVVKLRALDAIKVEKLGFSIERSINAFKQAIEIAMSGEKEITKEKYKDYIDSFKFYG
jgi:ribulose 1,5-bisphosphate carboxylase large subunit-like protein